MTELKQFAGLLPLPLPSGRGSYDDFDMHDYAARCVAAERERCAKIAEDVGRHDFSGTVDAIAAAIRKGETP